MIVVIVVDVVDFLTVFFAVLIYKASQAIFIKDFIFYSFFFVFVNIILRS